MTREPASQNLFSQGENLFVGGLFIQGFYFQKERTLRKAEIAALNAKLVYADENWRQANSINFYNAIHETGTPNIRSDARNQVKQETGNLRTFTEFQLQQHRN